MHHRMLNGYLWSLLNRRQKHQALPPSRRNSPWALARPQLCSHTLIAATTEKGALCSESADNCLQLDTWRTLAGSSLHIFLGSCLFVTCNTGFPNNAIIWASLVVQMVKSLPANAGDMGSIPWSGRSPGGGNGNPLQYSCPENPMDRRSWWATAHRLQRVGHDWVTEHTHTSLDWGSSFTDLSLPHIQPGSRCCHFYTLSSLHVALLSLPSVTALVLDISYFHQ